VSTHVHATNGRGREGAALNGDGSRPSDLAPDAYRLLEAFRWEWVRNWQDGDDESLGEWDTVGWLEVHQHQTLPVHQWRDGRLRGAAEELAACVQARIHGGPEPFDRLEAILLDVARGLYLLALYELDHRKWRLAKQVESEVAPGGQARYICLGTFGGNDYPKLAGSGALTIVSEVDHLGRRQDVRLGGYGGCLHSFPDLPFRPGRMWPSWCKTCGAAKSNAKQKAITEKKRSIREGPRTRVG
jgi:hypothetical protein